MPLLIVYDSSNSMWGELEDGTRKYEAGRRALDDALGAVMAERPVALRAYGHRDPRGCSDSELLVPFAAAEQARSAAVDAIAAIRPTGKTPITYSLRAAEKDLPAAGGEILLISDGIETCDIDPCELAQDWRRAAVPITIHVVGVGLSALERQAMTCLAEATGGRFFGAATEEDLRAALSTVGTAPPQHPASAAPDESWALHIHASDALQRSYVARGWGKLAGDTDEQRFALRTHRRNVLPGPGDYELEVGALLQDGSIYETSAATVSLRDPGDVRLTVEIRPPASVSAEFMKGETAQPGATVEAWQGGLRVFEFRPGDTVYARPGVYRFSSAPEAGPVLDLSAQLSAGEHTSLSFRMPNTVRAEIRFLAPDGERIERMVELWQDGVRRYRFHGGHGALVQPGRYDLRSPDELTPVHSYSLLVEPGARIYEIPIDSGFVVLRYAGDARDFTGRADRGFLVSRKTGKSVYMTPGQALAASPGHYDVRPHRAAGYFEPLAVVVRSGETVEAEVVAKATGSLQVRYRDSDTWQVPPDRAFVSALEGQEVRVSFLRPGVPVRLLPGRYRVTGWAQAGGVEPVELELRAGEQLEVELAPSTVR